MPLLYAQLLITTWHASDR